MRARGRRLVLAGLLGLSGLGGLGLSALGPAARATTPGVDGVSCSTWSTPTPDVAPVQLSQLSDGVPYVMVCGQGGHQTATVFVYGAGTAG